MRWLSTYGGLRRARLHPLNRRPAAAGLWDTRGPLEDACRRVGGGTSSSSHTAQAGQAGRTDTCAVGAFDIASPFQPTGDQPDAIASILKRLEQDCRFTVLRGATGTGKTFTMAHVINAYRRKTLLLCHNKTLAAQLARELTSYFPENCVELFVSYYNYYQPEAYLPGSDTYIAKTTSINDELDAFRHRATRALCEARILKSMYVYYCSTVKTLCLNESPHTHTHTRLHCRSMYTLCSKCLQNVLGH